MRSPRDLFSDEMMAEAKADASKMGESAERIARRRFGLHMKVVASSSPIQRRRSGRSMSTWPMASSRFEGTSPSQRAGRRPRATAKSVSGVKDVKNRLNHLGIERDDRLVRRAPKRWPSTSPAQPLRALRLAGDIAHERDVQSKEHLGRFPTAGTGRGRRAGLSRTGRRVLSILAGRTVHPPARAIATECPS
jgi:hypothetical protein